MAKRSKLPIPKKMVVPALVLGGLGIAGYFAYSQNMFGLKNIFKGGPAAVAGNLQQAASSVIPPQINPFTQQQQGMQQQPPIGDFYDDEYGGGSSQIFTPYTQGVGTVPGTNPSPYPQSCLPGYYRASDQKCYPIPTQFPGNGCEGGQYLANDGKCYPYPNGGLGEGGGGASTEPVPCPLGEYRASDGKCYSLPTAAPQVCPTGWYMASDNRCYRLDPNSTTPPACPTGYILGTDNICRGSTACPTGQHLVNGVCVANENPCPTGYNLVGNVCQPSPTTCPTGYHLVNGICTPGPTPGPVTVPPVPPIPPGGSFGSVITPWTVSTVVISKYHTLQSKIAELLSGKYRGARFKWLLPGRLLPQYYNTPYNRRGDSYAEVGVTHIILAEPLTPADFVKAAGRLAPGQPRIPGMYYGMRTVAENAHQLYRFAPMTSASGFFGGAAVIENKPRRKLNNPIY